MFNYNTVGSSAVTYAQVQHYLRTYSTDPGPYDFNGLLWLILAGVENLRENSIDQDFEDYACGISDEQALFLRRLLDIRPQSIAQQNEDT